MKTKKAPSSWKIVRGTVNTKREYISLTYKDDLTPVALVAPQKGKTFILQYLIKTTRLERKDRLVLDCVRSELKYYFITLGEKDPWQYAIYHCSTASNVYSTVHWIYHPKEGDNETISRAFVTKIGNKKVIVKQRNNIKV